MMDPLGAIATPLGRQPRRAEDGVVPAMHLNEMSRIRMPKLDMFCVSSHDPLLTGSHDPATRYFSRMYHDLKLDSMVRSAENQCDKSTETGLKDVESSPGTSNDENIQSTLIEANQVRNESQAFQAASFSEHGAEISISNTGLSNAKKV